MYAYCIIEYPVKTLDKAFTYLIPNNLKDKLKVGMKVLIPFNKRLVHGFVLKIKEDYKEEYELKEIARIEDEFLVLNSELMELGKYLKELTLCNLITAYQTMLPSALKIKTQKSDYNLYDSFVSLNKENRVILEYIENHRGKKVLILERLLEEGEVNKKEFDGTCIRELEKIGLVKLEKKKKYRLQHTKVNMEAKNLSVEQQKVINIVKNSFNLNEVFLLYGVTGSGKTLVYINLIKEVLKNNKTALLLVPEISLTEQIINIFYNYFGDLVAILHSGLSKTEKYDEYVKILNKDVKIVVGTRSAVFAPLENIGIIMIDEEHSDTYKQDSSPRYNAIDIAKKRGEYHKCPIILGSATPSLESMARAQKGVYKFLEMKKRINNQVLPECVIVDMNEEMPKRNFVISEVLDMEIKACLKKQEQVILLLNRRGFSTIITCSNCGFTYKCPNCEISLIYHKTSNSLRCHYCGFTKLKDDICPKCQEKSLNYLGMGTEKLESIIKEKYNEVRLIRMDADTTANKGMHDKLIKAFRNHEYDILIGTQMVSKGLDFPDCTLVGVLNADTSLNIPDFRSNERTFALLEQASGRAGRSSKKGKVIIQTFNPDNETILAVKDHNYEEFYQKEMEIRRVLKYPPYFYIVKINVCSKDYNLASKNATLVVSYLRKNLNKSIIILGPSTAVNFRLKNIYRFSIVVKYKLDNDLKNKLRELDNIYTTNNDVFLEIDFNSLHV